MDHPAATTAVARRQASLATLHGKERAVAPALARLGLAITVVPVDTDALGTFTGEVERALPPRETVVAKARLGMAASGLPVGLASEASFGPHPALPFVAVHEELLAFVDDTRGITHVERYVTTRTNFGHVDVADATAARDFLRRARFPGHAVIVRPVGAAGPIVKGVADPAVLAQAVAAARVASPAGLARVETDMRAHHNPRRLVALRRLARQLATRLATPCPRCGEPGFGPVDVERGLPCADCGTPTAAVRADVLGCLCGGCRVLESRPGLGVADPAVCPECNP
jgi:hypothetical protein